MTEYPDLKSFSRVIDVTGLDAEGRTYKLNADDADCEALQSFLNIEGVKNLSGSAHASRRGKLVLVKGSVTADLVRQCVASLEPMSEHIADDYDVEYTTDVPPPEAREEVQADLSAPEPLESPMLDLGQVIIEQLVLAMDPHPRKQDADTIVDPGAGAKISPFDVLKGMKSDD